MTALRFTGEQAAAIERRDGNLLLDAGAGSGKTTVLAQRFVESVRTDSVEVGRILTITFTEKAAAELRERIRAGLRLAGLDRQAREAEAAWISTIHGFCARLLRTHALTAGLDPDFTVLDAIDAQGLARGAFDRALAQVAGSDGGADLIATYGVGRLRAAIVSVYGQLRSRGQLTPTLPACQQAAGSGVEELLELQQATTELLLELGRVDDPGMRVSEALAMLERARQVLVAGLPWPGELDHLKLGNGAGDLRTPACERYRDALEVARELARCGAATPVRDALDALLRGYGEAYAGAKRTRSAVDFEDLELLALELLRHDEIAALYRERFERVMVDEMQDTNPVQLELIDRVAAENLFMVGDAQQSIYAFRHADVELFDARGRELEAVGARRSLRTNFRSKPEILEVIGAAFTSELGDTYTELIPGRSGGASVAPVVELLVVDRAADFEDEGEVAPWRLAEAKVLADRIRSLIDAGEATPGDVTVLTRATTDLVAYERALADAGVPTYVIGGRGYWQQPQVLQLICYLRALANPLDREAWYATLLSPLCGLSLDGMVLLADGAREELTADDRRRLEAFERWFSGERTQAPRVGAEQLIDRVIEWSGYEAGLLAGGDGQRRIANVRKLMRLARDWEAGHGTDLRGFVSLLTSRAEGDDGARESEAPVAAEALDAVRLMTIHRAKGLEFKVTCVADLGRLSTARGAPLIRVGRDGRRLGLRIGRPGTGGLIEVLDYAELKAEAAAAQAAEERRLFYVAMTRAQERLILSGAAHLFDWETKNRSAPIGWIGRALVPDIGSRLAERSFVSDRGVRVTFFDEASQSPQCTQVVDTAAAVGSRMELASAARVPYEIPPAASSPAVPQTLSYTALAEYERCGYRFYVERVLGLPGVDKDGLEPALPAELGASDQLSLLASDGMSAAERGTAIHELLRELDFGHPAVAAGTSAAEALVAGFSRSATARRLREASSLRREQTFVFLHGEVLITGAFDVLAQEAPGRLFVVDYKSDRIPAGVGPGTLVEQRYRLQRTIYALAALSADDISEVTVAHVFLEDADHPATRSYGRSNLPSLRTELDAGLAGLRRGQFSVTQDPGRHVCRGCPAAGLLCSVAVELTRR